MNLRRNMQDMDTDVKHISQRPVGELCFGLSGHLISFSNTCVTCVLADGHRRPLSCEDNCKDRSKKRATDGTHNVEFVQTPSEGSWSYWDTFSMISFNSLLMGPHLEGEEPRKMQPLFSLSPRRGWSPISMQTKSLPLPVHL